MNEKSVNIRGNDYYIKAFQGKKAFLIKVKLMPLISKVLAAFSKGDDKKEVDSAPQEVNLVEVIAKAAESIFTTLEPEKALSLVEEMLSETYKGNMKINFDCEFCANQAAIYELLFEVIKINYPDLFQMLGIDVKN